MSSLYGRNGCAIIMIEVKNLYKFYHMPRKKFFSKETSIKAVNGVSFTLREGETFGLVGESGSGKSTTGEIIVQLIKQTSGQVLYKGKDVSKFSASKLKTWRRKVQIVFQDPYASLNPKKTVQWILREPLMIHKMGNRREQDKRIIDMLHDVGLDESFLKRYPHELSGGQRQRVVIAAALILQPEFVVIDEGVSALDVSVQAQILNLLKALQKKYRLTYLFISHDLNVVQYFCDRIAVMYLGEMVEMGTVSDLDEPKHPYTKALFSSIPTREVNTSETVLSGEVPSASAIPEGCPFHTRCPFVQERCKHEKPVKHELTTEHTVRCHLYD